MNSSTRNKKRIPDKNEIIDTPKKISHTKPLTPLNKNKLRQEYKVTQPHVKKCHNENINRKARTERSYSKDENSKPEILKKIFLAHAEFNKEKKEYCTARFQIMLFLKNSNVFTENMISLNEADILLTKLKSSQNRFSFKDFINYLTELCKYIYKKKYDKSPKDTFYEFVDYILSNYDEYFQDVQSSNFIEKNIDNSCTIKSLEDIINDKINTPALKLLLSLYEQFKKLYMCYFSNELQDITEFTDKTKSFDNFVEFCKNFEIIPFFIKENNFSIYYNLLINFQNEKYDLIMDLFNSVASSEEGDNSKRYKDYGYYFKLSSFILFFYHFSYLIYYKKYKVQFNAINKKNIQINIIEIILLFLQKLEYGDGISKYLLKRHRTNETKFTFLPSNKDIEIALKDTNDEENENDFIVNDSILGKDLTEKNSESNIFTIEYNNNGENTLKSHYSIGNEKCKDINKKNNEINKKIIKDLNSTSSPNIKLRSKNNKNNKNNKDFILENLLNVDEDVIKIINDKMENLSELFLQYSKINDKLAYNKMSLSAFLLLLKNAKILSHKFTTEDASLVFNTLTNAKNFPDYVDSTKLQFDQNKGMDMKFGDYLSKTTIFDKKLYLENQVNIPGKMDLYLFIKSLELIASKLYPEKTLNEALLIVLNEHIFKILPEENIINSDEIVDAFTRLNKEEINYFLNELSSVILPLYEKFTDINGRMKFSHFLEFYKKFEIFPELISLVQMKKMFFTFTENLNEDVKNETIGFNCFMKSLAISAMFFNFRDIVSDLDRLLYLCNTIYQSKCVQECQLGREVITKFNKKFAQFIKKFKRKFENEKNKVKVENKDEINKKEIFQDFFDE